MATADDLLVSTSKDNDLITWSMKNKVDIQGVPKKIVISV